MEAPTMTALHIRIATLVLLAASASSARADERKETWVGKTVLNTKPEDKIQLKNESAGKLFGVPYKTQFTASLSGNFPIQVRDDKDGKLRIHDGVYEGWVDKADFVLMQEAPAFFERRRRANPKDAFAALMCGRASYSLGDFAEAIQSFDECLRLNPNNETCLNCRGLARRLQKDFENAISDFNEAIRLQPKSAAAFDNRGTVWCDKKEYGKALADFDKAIELEPRRATAFCNRAAVWNERKLHDKAIRDCDEAIRLLPNCAVAFNNRGNARLAEKEYDKAIKDLTEAIRLDPKLVSAFYNRGIAWFEKGGYGNYDKALLDFHDASRLDAKNPAAFYLKARCYALMGNAERALDNLQQALELGVRDVGAMEQDPALDSIRDSSSYRALLLKYRK
jgi:tetratricopeptide (TPR) repeat protein